MPWIVPRAVHRTPSGLVSNHSPTVPAVTCRIRSQRWSTATYLIGCGSTPALVTNDTTKEVTIILHEHSTLTGDAQKAINARKKVYVRFLETAFEQAMASGQIRKVNSTLAAFSFLGTVLWMYKWYRSDGALTPQQLADGIGDLFFKGLEPAP